MKQAYLPLLTLVALATVVADVSQAGRDAFHAGKLIPAYGMIAEVPAAAALPPDTTMKLAIDVVEGGETGKVNGKFQTAASFLNLMHANGVGPENVEIALVVHGPAHRDLLVDEAYGGDNPNAELLAALQQFQVSVYYCGQSQIYRDVAPGDLLPGVEVTLSATTTHVMLQQQGFSLRP